MEPYQEKRQSGEASVNGVILGSSDLKGDVNPLDDLKYRSGDNSRQQARSEADFRIRHKNVEEREKSPEDTVGQQIQRKRDNGTKCTQEGGQFNDQARLSGDMVTLLERMIRTGQISMRDR